MKLSPTFYVFISEDKVKLNVAEKYNDDNSQTQTTASSGRSPEPFAGSDSRAANALEHGRTICAPMHDARVFLKWTAIQTFFISLNIPPARRCCCWVCGTANAIRRGTSRLRRQRSLSASPPQFVKPLKRRPANPGTPFLFPFGLSLLRALCDLCGKSPSRLAWRFVSLPPLGDLFVISQSGCHPERSEGSQTLNSGTHKPRSRERAVVTSYPHPISTTPN